MSKENEYIARLKRRLAHLEERISLGETAGRRHDYDKAEASALQWAIDLAELALSNWPNGIRYAYEQAEERQAMRTLQPNRD